MEWDTEVSGSGGSERGRVLPPLGHVPLGLGYVCPHALMYLCFPSLLKYS